MTTLCTYAVFAPRCTVTRTYTTARKKLSRGLCCSCTEGFRGESSKLSLNISYAVYAPVTADGPVALRSLVRLLNLVVITYAVFAPRCTVTITEESRNSAMVAWKPLHQEAPLGDRDETQSHAMYLRSAIVLTTNSKPFSRFWRV